VTRDRLELPLGRHVFGQCALLTRPGMLSRGFTTVRDVGGANRHFKNATEQWLIPGPRLFQGGPVMSQTGGHGDTSSPDDPATCCPITPAGHSALGATVDGVDACLKVARKLMMAGADHIKICSSGGVASLTDKLESSQFTVPEIKAICDTVRMMVSRRGVLFWLGPWIGLGFSHPSP
jgi:imidazolonepropionase-like amidohydrolase